MPMACDVPAIDLPRAAAPVVWEARGQVQHPDVTGFELRLGLLVFLQKGRHAFGREQVLLAFQDAFAFPVENVDSWYYEPAFQPSGLTRATFRRVEFGDVGDGIDWG